MDERIIFDKYKCNACAPSRDDFCCILEIYPNDHDRPFKCPLIDSNNVKPNWKKIQNKLTVKSKKVSKFKRTSNLINI